MPLNDYDKNLIQGMFFDDCTVAEVLKVVPYAAPSTMQSNFEAFGQVRKPSSALKQMGAPRKITTIMREFLMELLSHRNDPWQEELVFELWCGFDIVVSQPTISRLMAEEALSSKVNTRIASRQPVAQQGVYLERLSALMAEGIAAGIEPMEMLVYLDESAASEKALFRRRS